MTSHRDVDGGWAWFVLAASYMNLIIAPGLAFVGGIFQNLFLEHFHQSVGLTAWVTSVFASLLQLAGPLASLIAHHSSCRVSVMLGGVLLTAGFVTSSFTSTLPVLFVSFGILSGLGLGLIYTPSIVVVNFFFKKKRTLINGIILSASGPGCLIFPLLCHYLLDTFTWREVLLILAAVSAQMICFGAVMFPIHEHNSSISCSLMTRLCQHKHIRKKNVLDLNVCDPMLTDHQENGDRRDVKTMQNISTTYIEKPTRNQLIIFKNTSFLALCLVLLLMNAGTGVVLIHFPAFCKQQGTTDDQISYVMAANGPALLVARILIGVLGNDPKVDKLAAFIGLQLISGSLFFVIPQLATTASTQITTMAVLAMFNGGSYALLTSITIHIVGLEFLTSAFGVEMIFAGCGFLIAPPFAGWIVDLTGSYNKSIFLAGFFIFLSAFVLMSIPIIRGRDSPTVGFRPVEDYDAQVEDVIQTNTLDSV